MKFVISKMNFLSSMTAAHNCASISACDPVTLCLKSRETLSSVQLHAVWRWFLKFKLKSAKCRFPENSRFRQKAPHHKIGSSEFENRGVVAPESFWVLPGSGSETAGRRSHSATPGDTEIRPVLVVEAFHPFAHYRISHVWSEASYAQVNITFQDASCSLAKQGRRSRITNWKGNWIAGGKFISRK